jgi:hypothetical protein
MSDLSARLDLPLIKPSQAQKHVTHNEALQLLDALVQAVIEETGAETPPFEPVEGQLHALGPAPTGGWAGEGGKLALRVADAWLFLTPREGWRAWDRAAGRYKVHDGEDWIEVAPDFDNLDGVGIRTASDTVNRLAVASAASLFSHDGAGHRVTVNKASDTDTASLLFQSGWTGHAEMGLAGGNDWSVKVSPDGATWTTALTLNKSTGIAGLLSGATIGGQPAFHRGNITGTVSQTGGTPSGAVIERGSNANGEYVRFADGTQMCWFTDTTSPTSNTSRNFPAAFAGADYAVTITPNPGSAARRSVEARHNSATTAVYNILDDTGARVAEEARLFAIGRWF